MLSIEHEEPQPGVIRCIGSPLAVNAVLLLDDDEAVVVDATATVAQGRAMASIVAGRGATLAALVNTHGHSDHCGGNRGVLGDSAAPLIVPRGWGETLHRERNMISRRPAKIDFPVLPHPRVVFERRLELACGRLRLELFHAPGHTPDSSLVWVPERELVIAADSVLAGSDPARPALPYFFWGDPWLLIASLERIRSLRPRLLIPGHGCTLRDDEIENLLAFQLDYLHRLLESTRELPRDLPLPAEDEPPAEWLAAAPIDSYLPGSPPEWVRRVHELNLLAVYRGLSALGV